MLVGYEIDAVRHRAGVLTQILTASNPKIKLAVAVGHHGTFTRYRANVPARPLVAWISFINPKLGRIRWQRDRTLRMMMWAAKRSAQRVFLEVCAANLLVAGEAV